MRHRCNITSHLLVERLESLRGGAHFHHRQSGVASTSFFDDSTSSNVNNSQLSKCGKSSPDNLIALVNKF